MLSYLPVTVHRSLAPNAVMKYTPNMLRIAAVADLHFKAGREEAIVSRFAGVAGRADVLLLPGDLTEQGTLAEAKGLALTLAGIDLPCFAVLGNHDFTSNTTNALIRVLAGAGVQVLDGEAAVIEVGGVSLGIAGAKGFGGGFGENALADTTEPERKLWLNRAIEEAEKMDKALASLDTRYRIAMYHYAPIRETIEGEHPETYPFYGSSHLNKPLERHRPDLVVHGHAHKGTHRGMTAGGVPVYNVAAKVIEGPYTVLRLGE